MRVVKHDEEHGQGLVEVYRGHSPGRRHDFRIEIRRQVAFSFVHGIPFLCGALLIAFRCIAPIEP